MKTFLTARRCAAQTAAAAAVINCNCNCNSNGASCNCHAACKQTVPELPQRVLTLMLPLIRALIRIRSCRRRRRRSCIFKWPTNPNRLREPRILSKAIIECQRRLSSPWRRHRCQCVCCPLYPTLPPCLAPCLSATSASIAPWAACSFMTPTTPHRVCLAAVRAATDATRWLWQVAWLGPAAAVAGPQLGPGLVVISVVFAKYFYACPFPKLALRQ